jgi:PAS domain S-box-containing protein
MVRAGKRFVGERRQGDGRIVSVTYNPLPDGGGVMTFSDITDAREREARVEESEARFRYLFRNSPMPMWVYTVDGRQILEVNEAAIEVYGYSREEFLRLTLLDLRPPEDAERLQRYLHGTSASKLYAGTWRHRHKDGKIADVDVYLPTSISTTSITTARRPGLRC